jgi:hypothetical protein
MSNTIKNSGDAKTLDRCDAAYRTEYECWRIVQHGPFHFRLIRCEPLPELIDISAIDPKGISAEMTMIQCDGARSMEDAETWLNIHRGRAAMRAALEAY